MVNKDITSYEVGKLQPNLTYEVRVQAAVEEMLGQVVTIVVSTLSYTSASTRFTSTRPTGRTRLFIRELPHELSSYITLNYEQICVGMGK